MCDFAHLHCHSHFSLLDGASHIDKMVAKIAEDGQKALALTDHGNMFGGFEFFNTCQKHGVKPIMGCEFYLVEDRKRRSFSAKAGQKDKRYHQLLLAKNATGYRNLIKLCSLGFTEGLYGKFPRIDKELILRHHEGLIATSCCYGAEIPQAIVRGDLKKAEELLKWWIDLLGEDYYIELQRHRGMEGNSKNDIVVSQEEVNQQLLVFAKKYDLKVIATNDAHYVDEDDWKPHDVILCVNTNSKIKEPNRFHFSSSDYYMKTGAEMGELFQDLPHALDNTIELASKVETLDLNNDLLLPAFPLPKGFSSQLEYLRHLVIEGSKIRYGEISSEIMERIDLELGIIGGMGYEGYFLIVQDFIKAARKLKVRVGPGRGSAAGSLIAYALTITDIDPLRYNLLFERFLNPERVSMPDIDIDFDDAGRQKVIDWVVDKYGKSQVAQIITFGTMAARSSVRDVARVMEVPLDISDQLAKLVPSRPGTKLKKVLTADLSELKEKFNGEEMSQVYKLREILDEKDERSETLEMAMKLEGTVRNTGIHAAGVIIAPDDITNYIPVSKPKDSDFYVTQYDGTFVEKAGMLKMDFLGLTTLSIINDCLEMIKENHGIEMDLDDISLEDEKTYQLFQRGDTSGIFQFESSGMRRSLIDLKPTNIEDLIAMNALFRPGPMDYIPLYVRRKHGKEPIEYPHEWLKTILEPTYGIMVYQEQIMQAAQIMADFSLGSADILRRAMGKKKKKDMDEQRIKFVDGAGKKGVSESKANEIFDIMAKFASYGFNRSHAAAYSILAYQTAYLKVHYTPEYMASILSHEKGDMNKLNEKIRNARKLGIQVLGPDINRSALNFRVNESGDINFGLSALKGVGEGVVNDILEERRENGAFKDLIDFSKRVKYRSINKRVVEALVKGGAFDGFGDAHRAQLIAPCGKFDSYYEAAMKYGAQYQIQSKSSQASLFGVEETFSFPPPEPPVVREWSDFEKLKLEKEISGIYLSGHPLLTYQMEIDEFSSCTLGESQNIQNRELTLAGLVTRAEEFRKKSNGAPFGKFEIQDFSSSLEFMLFSDTYLDFKPRLDVGNAVILKGYWYSDRGGSNRFRLNSVQSLEKASSLYSKGLTVGIPLEMINSENIEKLSDLIKEYEGEKPIRFSIEDLEDDIQLMLRSKHLKVDICTKFIGSLKSLGLAYKITKK